MGVVCVYTLGLGSICQALWSNGVIIAVLSVKRNKLGGPTSIYSMPRQKYPNLPERSLSVFVALETETKCAVNC